MQMTAVEYVVELWRNTHAEIEQAQGLALDYVQKSSLPDEHKPYLASAMYIAVMSYLDIAVRYHEDISLAQYVKRAINGADNATLVPFPHNDTHLQTELVLNLTSYAERAVILIKEAYARAV